MYPFRELRNRLLASHWFRLHALPLGRFYDDASSGRESFTRIWGNIGRGIPLGNRSKDPQCD